MLVLTIDIFFPLICVSCLWYMLLDRSHFSSGSIKTYPWVLCTVVLRFRQDFFLFRLVGDVMFSRFVGAFSHSSLCVRPTQCRCALSCVSLKAQCLADTSQHANTRAGPCPSLSGWDGTLSGRWNCGCLPPLRPCCLVPFGNLFLSGWVSGVSFPYAYAVQESAAWNGAGLLGSLVCEGALERLNALSLTDPVTWSPHSWINQREELALQEHVFIFRRRNQDAFVVE